MPSRCLREQLCRMPVYAAIFCHTYFATRCCDIIVIDERQAIFSGAIIRQRPTTEIAAALARRRAA